MITKVAATVLVATLLAGQAAAQSAAEVRDRWGLREQDWKTLRAGPFMDRLAFDYRGRRQELVQAASAGDGKALVIVALGLRAGKIQFSQQVDPQQVLQQAATTGLPFADYLYASFTAPKVGQQGAPAYLQRLQKAVDGGHLAARQRLGAEYLRGERVPRDVAKAESLIRSDHPDLAPLAKYYQALVYLTYDEKRRDRPKAVAMLRELADRDHAPSRRLLNLLNAQDTVGTYLQTFEVSKGARPPKPIASFEHVPCWTSFRDSDNNDYRWVWEYIRISPTGTTEGELKFSGAGPDFLVKPTRPVNQGSETIVLGLAKDLNGSCKDFSYFVEEDGKL